MVHGPGALGVPAAGARGEHDVVRVAQRVEQLLLVRLLDVQDERFGAGGADVLGVVGVADEGDDVVAGLRQQGCGEQGHLAVAADDHGAGHGDLSFGSIGC